MPGRLGPAAMSRHHKLFKCEPVRVRQDKGGWCIDVKVLRGGSGAMTVRMQDGDVIRNVGQLRLYGSDIHRVPKPKDRYDTYWQRMLSRMRDAARGSEGLWLYMSGLG